VSIVYAVIILFAVVGIVSFAVDYARVQVAKTQLRAAADAAARAAVVEVGTVSTVQNAAIQYAAANTCDGTAISITTADIDFLDWNPATRTYTVLSGANRNNADAVRVNCSRTGTNGISLLFGGLIGRSTCDVHASAIAAMTPPGYGLVGLNYITLSGNSSTSYWSSSGSVSGNSGNIASNGNITSTGNSAIQGTVWTLAGATVTGVSATHQKTLPSALTYPNGDPSPYSTSYNNNTSLPGSIMNSGSVQAGSKSVPIPAGAYVVQDFSSNPSSVLTLQGPVTFYVYGTISLKGTLSTYNSVAKNLNIVMIPNPSTGAAPGSVTIASSGALYGSIYAPQSDVTLSGSGAIYGSVVGKSITMSGTSDIYYDLSNNGNVAVIQLVK
jgi:Flp pilus assembly protein TadG